MQALTVIKCGSDTRMEPLIKSFDGETSVKVISPDGFFLNGHKAEPLLFMVSVDALGMDEDFIKLIRGIRSMGEGLFGCTAGVIMLGSTELDTKDAARRLIFALDMAGCAFCERPLVEATGSMRNLRTIKRTQELGSYMDALIFSAAGLVKRLSAYTPVRFDKPRLLVLHASDRPTSNTLALGDLVLDALDESFTVSTMSLRNGTIEDCRGCAYKVCSHFASKGSCFYGGSISQEVLPAVRNCDALMLLLPNYNDAVGANVMAFINRLTGLHVSGGLSGQRLFAVAVSGYSGGDIVAMQAMGALCLNKAFVLPPFFCLMETANDPGEAVSLPGIKERAALFASRIEREMLSK